MGYVQVTAVPFGSVPLNTYLPDGDIDLSIYSTSPSAQALKETLRENWTTQLEKCLIDEANNPNAVFRVADVHVINAEVRWGALLDETRWRRGNARTSGTARPPCGLTGMGALSGIRLAGCAPPATPHPAPGRMNTRAACWCPDALFRSPSPQHA